MSNRKFELSESRKGFAIALLAFSLLQVSAPQADARKPKHSKTPVQTCQNHKQMEKITSFSYHQSGGFAAVNRNYSVQLADLSNDEREKLESLIDRSGLLTMKKEHKTTPGAADMFFYEFTANSGGEHTATFDDGSLPDAFKPLRDYAKDKAVNAKKMPGPGAM